MYTLQTPLQQVSGVGAVLGGKLADAGLHTVQDLLLQVPLRYEDRSQLTTISELEPDKLLTVEAQVDTVSQFRKNGRLIITATVSDHTGKLKLMWFNTPFITRTLKKGETYIVSGKLSKYGTMTHPTVERAQAETLHTNRIVPLYTSTLDLKQGTLRRVLKAICDDLQEVTNDIDAHSDQQLSLREVLTSLHFPDEEEHVVAARRRLALEELVSLIITSNQIKADWHATRTAPQFSQLHTQPELPFTLTAAQQRSVTEITTDLQQSAPMNRMLLGDVGSGKTVVAGLAMLAITEKGYHAALVAPTQMLARQHAQTLSTLFPDENIVLITGKGVEYLGDSAADVPSLLIGTHAVLNYVAKQDPPIPIGLLVFDEQHRFGVAQRSKLNNYRNPDQTSPHILTMTATPIPRSLMLTIFSHLQLSVIDELPANRIPTKTWLLPEGKRADSYDWCAHTIAEHVEQEKTAITLLVCPFVEQSEVEGFDHIPAATVRYQQLQAHFKNSDLKLALLHGKQKATQKDKIISDLYENKIDILVTTPIVEVGVDLPQASVIIIEAAERFGLATLHQLRGRVGRAGQQGYCMLFTSKPPSPDQKKRLKLFCETLNGQKLAEYDLENRGAGDLFGTDQSGFEQLHFASWSDKELIHEAQTIARSLSQTPNLLFSPVHTQKVGAN